MNKSYSGKGQVFMLVQKRYPRSKKKRIRKKFAKDMSNYVKGPVIGFGNFEIFF